MDILSGEKLPHRYFFILKGNEPYAFSQLEDVFTKKFLPDDPSFFNRLRFECDQNTKGSDIVNALEEYPFGSQYRLIFAYNANKMKSSEGDKIKHYLADPADTSILVITENDEELKKSSSGKFHPSRTLKKEINKFGLVISCSLNHREIRDWVTSQFSRNKIRIDSSSINLMIEMVGDNLWDLSREIEKIILYIGDSRRIDIEDVRAVTSHRPRSKIFNLTEKVGNRDISSSLVILDELVREKTPGVMILTSLNNHFTFLYRISELVEEGEYADTIAKKLRKHPFYVKKSMGQARKYSTGSIEKIYDLIGRADGALKSGMSERIVLEMTLIQICKQKR